MSTNVKINELPLKTVVKDTDLVVVQDNQTTNVITAKDLMINKVDKSELSAVAYTGNYEDLINKPSVVTIDTDQLINYHTKTITDALLSLKADKTALDAVETALLAKADKNSVYTKFETMSTEEITTALTSKANTSDVYPKATVDEKLSYKADTSDVQAALALKASKEELNDGLALKADKIELDGKASKTVVEALGKAVNSLTGEIGNKADKATTLAGYNISDAYTSTQVDEKITTAISSTYRHKGSVLAYENLPLNNKVGDVWNVQTKHTTDPKFEAGTNVAWNGTGWDPLAGMVDLSNYSTTVECDGRYALKTHEHEIGDIKLLQTKLSTLTNGKADVTYVDSTFATKLDIANKAEMSYVDTQLSTKANASETYTITDVDNKLVLKLNKADLLQALKDLVWNGFTRGQYLFIDNNGKLVSHP